MGFKVRGEFETATECHLEFFGGNARRGRVNVRAFYFLLNGRHGSKLRSRNVELRFDMRMRRKKASSDLLITHAPRRIGVHRSFTNRLLAILLQKSFPVLFQSNAFGSRGARTCLFPLTSFFSELTVGTDGHHLQRQQAHELPPPGGTFEGLVRTPHGRLPELIGWPP